MDFIKNIFQTVLAPVLLYSRFEDGNHCLESKFWPSTLSLLNLSPSKDPTREDSRPRKIIDQTAHQISTSTICQRKSQRSEPMSPSTARNILVSVLASLPSQPPHSDISNSSDLRLSHKRSRNLRSRLRSKTSISTTSHIKPTQYHNNHLINKSKQD